MPSLADLWDEDKYSEGDPVRQLIAFSKSIPDWPKDVLNFGNESIDSLTSMIPNKGLHTNLRGKLYDPMYSGETSVSATPGEDVQNAKHLAKAMNPLLWAGGQELNTFGLRKMLTDAFDKAPRVENRIYSMMPGQKLKDTKYVQRNVRNQAEIDHIVSSGYMLPKEGGKSVKYFTATDDVNPNVPDGNTMLRINRDKIRPDRAVSSKDIEKFNFVTNSWESLSPGKYSMEINPSRRGFIFGKAAADVVHPLEAPLDEILNTPMTRRTVNKGLAAGAAGVAMGGGLLSKFAKVPEAAKALETVAPIAEQASKYKYNTLAEYLDDVQKRVIKEVDNDIQNPLYENDFHLRDNPDTAESYRNYLIEGRLKQDEAMYSSAKKRLNPEYKKNSDTMFDDLDPGKDERILNQFSPQAKKEMKDYKSKVNSIFPNVEGKPNIDWHDSSLMQSYLDDIKNIGEVQW